MNKLCKIAVTAVVGALSCFGALAWRAHTNLVTLHVRNAALPDVVSKLRWQTWESFVVNTNVHGTVTLDVDKMPLDSVLAIMGEQLNARWTAVYPIYREKASLVSLKRALQGEAKLADTKFTNYAGRAMGPRGEGPIQKTEPVTLHLTNTDLAISAMALERFGGGQVLVEKGSSQKVSLELSGAPFEKAVTKIAQSANRSSTKLYAIEPMRNFGRMDLARGEGRGRPQQMEPNSEAEAQRMEKMQQVMQTLPEEEQKRAEERQLERMTMQSMTPEQRQQAMSDRMSSPEMQQRVEQRAVSGIKNTTPEQRRDRYERMYEMRKARAAGVAPRG